ncbi:MAG: M90 family metallopeptidase [bacterium]
MNWIKRWLLRRGLIRDPLTQAVWVRTLQRARLLSHLDQTQIKNLRALTSQLLLEKTFSAVQGLELSEEIKAVIATQACVPILNIGLDAYDGWIEIIVYPGSFHVSQEQVDESGVVTEATHLLSGESWGRGPLILSWEDVLRDTDTPRPGHNVVIHEFAHKLDMLNGRANGMPPLHPDMPIEAWTEALSTAYARLQHRLEHHHHTDINPYAGTNPAEFFAVLSEYFFTAPWVILEDCPPVYHQLKTYYRLDTQHWYSHGHSHHH